MLYQLSYCRKCVANILIPPEMANGRAPFSLTLQPKLTGRRLAVRSSGVVKIISELVIEYLQVFNLLLGKYSIVYLPSIQYAP